MRILFIALLAGVLVPAFPQVIPQRGDWSAYGRDPGGTRYSPLDQMSTKNVTQLQRAWTYHNGERGRGFETTAIVVDGIVALDPETGQEIWKYDPKSNGREHRGVAFWPGDKQTPSRILLGTGDGRLIALDAKTGVPAGSFGDNGVVKSRASVAHHFPRGV